MSFNPTSWRVFARSGLGAAGHWRGALSPASIDRGLPDADPQVLGTVWYGQIGTVTYRSRGPSASFSLIGVTADHLGAALGGCTVKLYRGRGTSHEYVATLVSDASGNFRFDNPGTGPFFMRIYLPGSPDVAAVSTDLLMPTPTP
jgi:hypothetical protein